MTSCVQSVSLRSSLHLSPLQFSDVPVYQQCVDHSLSLLSQPALSAVTDTRFSRTGLNTALRIEFL